MCVCVCVCVCLGAMVIFCFSFDELIFSRHQPSTLGGDEWVINVAAIWSKSICGDPPCSADPEGKARGSVRAGGEEEGRDPPERCTCTIRPFTCLTFIVFIDWTGGGAGSQTHRITTTSLLLYLPPTLSGSILNPSSIIDQQSVHINISLCMLIMTYSQCFGSVWAQTQRTGIRERAALKAECCVASRLLSLQPTANKLVCFIYDVKTVVMLMKLFFWHYTLTNIDDSNHLKVSRSCTKWVKSWILQQHA